MSFIFKLCAGYNFNESDRFCNLFYIVYCFLIALLVSSISLPLINNFALKSNLLDFVDLRKQKRIPIPRIGGLGIFLGIFASLLFLIFNTDLNLLLGKLEIILLLSIGFFLIGFVDDILNISPWPRLVIQFSLSSIAWFQDIRIESIDLSYLNIGPDIFLLPKFLSFILTLVWIVGLTNAINWIDGLDGLAIGVTLIGVTGLIIINYKLKQFDSLFILLPVAGSCLSFFRFNFYPAKILMGDGGSYLLGFLVAIVSIISTTRFPLGNSETFATAIYLPVILFSIPIFDMLRVIVKRILEGRSPFYPDKQHLHHRLMACGLNHKNTVLLIYLLSAFTASISVALVD